MHTRVPVHIAIFLPFSRVRVSKEEERAATSSVGVSPASQGGDNLSAAASSVHPGFRKGYDISFNRTWTI